MTDKTPDFDNEDLPVQDELTTLKARADMMGLNYHPSIGLETLRERVNAAVTNTPKTSETNAQFGDTPQAGTQKETEAQRRSRKRKEATELVRIRVTCMNPAKKEWEGEIFTAGNAVVGTHRKYVPFNADEGWHVPRIIYNQLKDKQCQTFVSKRNSRGHMDRVGKLIKEFAIEVLPPLTPEELKELARRQAMARSID